MSKYNYGFKKKIVMSYLNGMGSYKDLAKLYKNPSDTRIQEWVRIYNSFEDEGLMLYNLKRNKRRKTLDKLKIDSKTQKTEERIVDTSAEYVKELEDELHKLRIENAFLKELRRLRLEDEAKMRERRSSSIASQEKSN